MGQKLDRLELKPYDSVVLLHEYLRFVTIVVPRRPFCYSEGWSYREFEKNQAKFSGKVVIPYCTVGGRCADFSRQLAQAGWTVRSYRGRIVEWVQNELPLATPKGESTTKLHTNGGVFKLPSKYKSVPN